MIMDNFQDMINRNALKKEKSHLEINQKGNLTLCEIDTVEIAKQFGTPLFVFNEDKIRQNFRNMRAAFKKHYEKIEICFAYKSNSLLSVLQVLKEEGAYADVVSEGEYYKALNVGVDSDKIIFNGNNKSRREIKKAIMFNSIINADSLNEIEMIIEEAKIINKPANICIRVNPNVSVDIIDEFSTGIKKSKFGVDIDNGDAIKAFESAVNSEYCNVKGIHAHIGSQIEKSEGYKLSAEKIMDFCGKLKQKLHLDLEYINLGGGYAIPFEYLDKCDTFEDFANVITAIIKEKVEEYNMKEPFLLIEPGGSLIGNTAITLMSVGTVKQKENKKLAALNGGADILLRATQGWYTYRAECANKMNESRNCLYDLVGPLCYEGDITAHDRKLPKLEENDIIAFIDTGAYTVSLMNHYNCRLLPAILMVNSKGEIKIIRRREESSDLFYKEI